MTTGAKVALGIGIPLVLIGGFFTVRYFMRNSEDDLTITFGEIDWNKRTIPYTIYANGKFDQSGTYFWRSDLVGKKESMESGTLKNKIYTTNVTNGFIIRGESLTKNKFSKIIDFNSKIVRDYIGSNVNKDIAAAQNTLTHLFT